MLDAPLTGTPMTFHPVEGNSLTGVVAAFTDANPFGKVGDYSATIDWGDGTPTNPDSSTGAISQPGGPGTAFVVTGTHTYAEEGTYYSVEVSITSIDVPPQPSPITPSSTKAASTAIVADAPLVSTINSSITTIEGSPFPDAFPKLYPGSGVVIATFTDGNPLAWPDASEFQAAIVWSYLGSPINVTPGQVVHDPTTPGQFDVLGNVIFDEAGIYQVKVLIGDIGGSTTIASGTVTVNDAPLTSTPAGTPANPLLSVAGSMFTGVVALFSDGNPFGVNGDFAAVITWADGSTSPGTIQADPGGGFDVVGSHIYRQDGSYSITTTITSIDVSPPITPSSTTATSTMVVDDAPILASSAQPPNGVEGSAYPGLITVATFTDGNSYVVASDFSAIITWGDGQTSAGTVVADPHLVGQFDVQANHTYVEDGIYVGSVAITDTAGNPAVPQATAAVALSATVLDASLVAGPAVSVPNQVAGQLFSGVVGTFSDGNPFANDPNAYLVSIFWGDGTPPSAGTVVQTGPATFEVLGTHIYTQEAPNGAPNSHPYRVTVQITDIDADQLPPPPPSIPRSATSTMTSITVTVASLSLVNATIPRRPRDSQSRSLWRHLPTLMPTTPRPPTPARLTGATARARR